MLRNVIEILLSTAVAPFALALGLLVGLLVLELLMALFGGSLMGEIDAPEVDVPAVELDLGYIDVPDVDLAELELDIGAEADSAPAPAGGAGPAAWLGLGKAPTLIWIGVFLATFGLSGLGLQVLSDQALGAFLPSWIAAAPATVAGLWGARSFSAGFARVLPQVETQSISERAMGRRKGVVSQGTAARGRPAEVKVTDGYGNTHYFRAEPLRDEDSLPKGTEVLVLRHRPTGSYRLIALS